LLHRRQGGCLLPRSQLRRRQLPFLLHLLLHVRRQRQGASLLELLGTLADLLCHLTSRRDFLRSARDLLAKRGLLGLSLLLFLRLAPRSRSRRAAHRILESNVDLDRGCLQAELLCRLDELHHFAKLADQNAL
jgi:hypothetical protein